MSDVQIARKYVKKSDACNLNRMPFKLSFTSFKNMMKARKCAWTGIELTTPRGNGKPLRDTDITIDRIDNSKGYIHGNVVACCHGANKLKSQWENPTNMWTPELVVYMANKVIKAKKEVDNDE